MSGALVSHVMPVWRPRADWLAAAVGACLGQTGCEVELVVVDDGNDTPVAELLAAVRDPRLRIVRTEHAGVAAARNAGMAAARGGWLRFADADDVCEPGSTARLLALAAAGPPAIAYGATLMCDEELRPRWTMSSRARGDARRVCLLGAFHVRLPALLVPRAVADAAGAWDPALTICEDWDYILRALEHAPVRGDGAPAARYRRHRASATAEVARAEEAIRQVVGAYFDRHPEDAGTPLRRRAHAATEAILARVALTHGQPGAAARHLASALAADPRGLLPEARLAAQRLRRRTRLQARDRRRTSSSAAGSSSRGPNSSG